MVFGHAFDIFNDPIPSHLFSYIQMKTYPGFQILAWFLKYWNGGHILQLPF